MHLIKFVMVSVPIELIVSIILGQYVMLRQYSIGTYLGCIVVGLGFIFALSFQFRVEDDLESF